MSASLRERTGDRMMRAALATLVVLAAYALPAAADEAHAPADSARHDATPAAAPAVKVYPRHTATSAAQAQTQTQAQTGKPATAVAAKPQAAATTKQPVATAKPQASAKQPATAVKTQATTAHPAVKPAASVTAKQQVAATKPATTPAATAHAATPAKSVAPATPSSTAARTVATPAKAVPVAHTTTPQPNAGRTATPSTTPQPRASAVVTPAAPKPGAQPATAKRAVATAATVVAAGAVTARAVSMTPAVTPVETAKPKATGVVTPGPSAARPMPGPDASPIADKVTYQYNAIGRRDPFLALVGGGFVGAEEELAPPDVGGIKVVGIVWGSDDKFALVEDPRGNSHVLRTGDKVMNGVVDGLRRDAMIVKITTENGTDVVTIPLTRKGDESNANR